MSNRIFQDSNDEQSFTYLSKFLSMFNLNKSSTSTPLNKTKPNLNSTDFLNKKNTWEFEWMGKAEREKPETPLPSFCRVDSDDEQDNKNTKTYQPKTNANFIFNNSRNSFQTNLDNDDEEDYEFDTIHNLKDGRSFYSSPTPKKQTTVFECQYCAKSLNDFDSHQKHQSICKRLSHTKLKNKYYSTNFSSNDSSPDTTFSSNSAKSNSSLFVTECPKCKLTMNSYDYLSHNCAKKTNWSFEKEPENTKTKDMPRTTSFSANNNTASQPSASTTNTSTKTPTSSYNPKSDFIFTSKYTRKPSATSTTSSIPKYSATTATRASTTQGHTRLFDSENYSNLKSTPKNDYIANPFYRPAKLSASSTSMGFSSSYMKPYSSLRTPVYTKSRLSNLSSNNNSSGTNMSSTSASNYTNLKREKLRTGF